MRGALLSLTLAAALNGSTGCGPVPITVMPPAPASPVDRLAAADRLVGIGCLDCLIEAFGEYDRLRSGGPDDNQITIALIRTGALITLRERELGLIDSGYLTRARDLAATMTPTPESLIELLAIADALPYGSPASRPAALQERRMLLQVSRDWLTAPEPPSGLAVHRELFGYVWLALACEPGVGGAMTPEQARAGLGEMRDLPLLLFKFATACDRRSRTGLAALLAQAPQFVELNYYLGLAALGGQSRADLPGRPDLDEADARLRDAYAWRSNWPALTVILGNIAITAEDYTGALDFYRQTLMLAPDQPDALLGAVRSLTSLDRHQEAIAIADQLIAAGRYPGDARYWRALNEVHLSQFDQAWDDIELATTLLVNADVPKLAGIIAINRQAFDVARRRLEEANERRPADCEVGFYLQIVLSEQRDWAEAAGIAGRAGACFDQDEAQLRREIDDLQASDFAPAKRDRLTDSRRLRIASNQRMRAACWFNAAAAHFNLGAMDQARAYADKVLEDERFGDRARDLIGRLETAR